jgi:hypothetical protein
MLFHSTLQMEWHWKVDIGIPFHSSASYAAYRHSTLYLNGTVEPLVEWNSGTTGEWFSGTTGGMDQWNHWWNGTVEPLVEWISGTTGGIPFTWTVNIGIHQHGEIRFLQVALHQVIRFKRLLEVDSELRNKYFLVKK